LPVQPQLLHDPIARNGWSSARLSRADDTSRRSGGALGSPGERREY
jgi:hypothetical protein